MYLPRYKWPDEVVPSKPVSARISPFGSIAMFLWYALRILVQFAFIVFERAIISDLASSLPKMEAAEFSIWSTKSSVVFSAKNCFALSSKFSGPIFSMELTNFSTIPTGSKNTDEYPEGRDFPSYFTVSTTHRSL